MTEKNKKPKRPAIKRGVRQETINNVSARMKAADNATTDQYAISNIPLSSIKLWGDQPRKLKITLEDVIRGKVLNEDPHYDRKDLELSSILTLAFSISDTGINNPPLAYWLPGQIVMLIGGQRRTMAAVYSLFHIIASEENPDIYDVKINKNPDLLLLNTTKIKVKVYARKPSPVMMEKIAMSDNISEKLPLKDRIDWAIQFSEKKEEENKRLHWTNLTSTVGISRSQAFNWVKVIELRTNEWVARALDLVRKERLTFSKLVDIANAEDKEEAFYKAVGENRPVLDGLKSYSLGATTKNVDAIKKLILTNIDKSHHKLFDSIDWEKPVQVKKAFADFFKLWEKQIGQA